MKKFLLWAVLALALPVMAQVPTVPMGGPGIATGGSATYAQLPDEARRFLQKHFKDNVVATIHEEFANQEYDVTMVDGTEIEFDSKGRWQEVEAGYNHFLPPEVTRALLPRKAKDTLERSGAILMVESVKRSDSGYKVELRDVEMDDYRFSRDGTLKSISD